MTFILVPDLQNDIRQYIPLSSFGFYTGGHLIVKISEFALQHGEENKVVSDFPPQNQYRFSAIQYRRLTFIFQFGLSLDKTVSDAMRQNTDLHQDRCFLEDKNLVLPTNEPALFFIMNFKRKEVMVNCSKNWRNMDVFSEFHNAHRK